jgi:hypothetical protein
MRRFDKVTHPEYQSHVYSAAERTALVASIAKRAGIVAKSAPKLKTTKTTVAPDA